MSVKSVELRKEAVALNEQVATLLKTENRTKEQNSTIDKMLADADVKLNEAKRLEASEKIETENRSRVADPGASPISDKDKKQERRYAYETDEQRKARTFKERRAFYDFVFGDCNEESAKYMHRDRTNGLTSIPSYEQRAQDAVSNPITAFTANASFLVPQGFQYELEIATKAYGNLLGDARVVDTASGNPLYWPTENDTAQKAHVVSESTQVNENDLTLGHVLFGAWKYTADVVRISLELEQDSFESIENIVKDAFAIRWGRGLNYDFTVGDGNQKSTGIIPAIAASGASPVTAAGSYVNDGNVANTGTNSIGYEDYVNLIHSIDPSYRNRPKTRFMFHDQVLQSARRLLDKFGRPLWMPGMAANAPDTILGYPYSINQQMPTAAGSASPFVPAGTVFFSGNPTVVFGDLSKFIIRRVKEMSVMRLVERYADFGEVGLLSFGRYDSQLVDAGTHPINYLQQA
jgi:HK97 family phage major capsid protein